MAFVYREERLQFLICDIFPTKDTHLLSFLYLLCGSLKTTLLPGGGSGKQTDPSLSLWPNLSNIWMPFKGKNFYELPMLT